MHSCSLERYGMFTSKNGKTIDATENTNRGTGSLKKRKQMTQNQAYYSGLSGRADLHMHSTFSDGLGTIQQILHHAQHNTDLNVIALTDHNVVEGALRARDLWARGNYRFDFIVGEEISTREGHMLALFIEKRIPPDLSIERSIDLVHEQGGLAIVAHPLNPLFRHSCQREVLDRIFENDDVWLRYDHLVVRDAGGRELAAKFEAEGREISLLVNDTDAVYPVDFTGLPS